MRGKAGFRPAAPVWRVVLCCALFVAVAAVAGAAARTAAKPMELPARVIAHLPLTIPAGNLMVLEKQGDKRYLYIQQASKEGYTIVEVTQPEFPSFVNRQAPASDPPAGKAETDAAVVTVAEAPDTTAKTSIRSLANIPETVKVMDVSDPDHPPTTLQTLNNIISFLADGTRGVFYVANDEGLWVLKLNRHQEPPAKEKDTCDLYPALARENPKCKK